MILNSKRCPFHWYCEIVLLRFSEMFFFRPLWLILPTCENWSLLPPSSLSPLSSPPCWSCEYCTIPFTAIQRQNMLSLYWVVLVLGIPMSGSRTYSIMTVARSSTVTARLKASLSLSTVHISKAYTVCACSRVQDDSIREDRPSSRSNWRRGHWDLSMVDHG